jgi:hypothetical protein
MASYDDWKDAIGELPFVVPYHATMGRVRDMEWYAPLPEYYEENYGVNQRSKYPQKVVVPHVRQSVRVVQ